MHVGGVRNTPICYMTQRPREAPAVYTTNLKRPEGSRNRNLFSSSSDPFAPFRPETDSPHHVCAVMADVLHSHHLMKPPLFEPFLPFMNGVLNSALRKYATTDR